MAMFNSYVKLPEGISSEMWVKQCHKAPIFLGMVKKNTYGDLGDGLWHCFTHINHH
jgi:uncharacterized protein CbrC (UPF0167 family)